MPNIACMGFEAQDVTAYLNLLAGTDYSSINTNASFVFDGAASLLVNKPNDGLTNEFWRTIAITATTNFSCSFGFIYDSGLASTAKSLFHTTAAAIPGHGVGFLNDVGSIRITLGDDTTGGLTWMSTTVLTPGTKYICQWQVYKDFPVLTNGIWYAQLRLRDSAGALIEDSGVVKLTENTSKHDTATHIAFGVGNPGSGGGAISGALKFYIDNVVAASGIGTWAPQIAHVVKQTANNAEATDTAFTLGAGANEWTAVKDIPHDSDTTYILKGTGGGSQTYNLTATGVTLAAGEEIFVAGMYAIAKKTDAGTGTVTARIRINSVLYTGGSISAPAAYTYLRFWQVPPAAGWTIAQFDAGELGVARGGIGTTVELRCTQLVLEMAYGIKEPGMPEKCRSAILG